MREARRHLLKPVRVFPGVVRPPSSGLVELIWDICTLVIGSYLEGERITL